MNWLKSLSLTGAFIAAIAAGACSGNENSNEAAAAAPIAEATKALDQLVAKGSLPGAIVIVEQNGERLADIVTGYQDVEKKEPLTKDAIFRLYSMSKPITSIAILMLADQGKLKLDDPVGNYLPALADMQVYDSGDVDHIVTVPAKRPITIHDLLTHTSGIPYHFSGNTPVHQYYRKHGIMRDTPVGRTPEDGPPASNLAQLVDRIGHAPLLFQPGEKFEYSYSTTVLGAVIEAVSGERLDQFLQKNIFAPLEMNETGFFIEDTALDRFVTGYAATPEGLVAIEQPETSDYRDHDRLLDGGGALAGTAEDYLKFATMLARKGEYKGKRLVSEALIDQMFSSQVTISGWGPNPVQFGYGLAIGDANSDALGMQPDGSVSWSGSGNTYFFVNPKTGVVALLMTHIIVSGTEQARTLEFRSLVNHLAKEITH
ncbi:serine hydrolase domain-containing protein [Pseudokordiimonas caeni]|uniref:serine hydrolase domain-containing protein n=1 Tax=Pseudokordiimonas caeni TaxID=2997908 RepID=UPI0028112DFE|nr:serine hydrolase domain-containing protein [Pseudokordiimonas caeni]